MAKKGKKKTKTKSKGKSQQQQAKAAGASSAQQREAAAAKLNAQAAAFVPKTAAAVVAAAAPAAVTAKTQQWPKPQASTSEGAAAAAPSAGTSKSWAKVSATAPTASVAVGAPVAASAVPLALQPLPATPPLSPRSNARRYSVEFLLAYRAHCTEEPSDLPGLGDLRKALHRDSHPPKSNKKHGKQGQGGKKKHGPGKHHHSYHQAPLILGPVKPLDRSADGYHMVNRTTLAVDEALRRDVTMILNKLTPEKFDVLLEAILALDIDSVDRLNDVAAELFKKALSEPNFSTVYADFAVQLAERLPTFTTEEDGEVSFKRLLLTRCRNEFDSGETSAGNMASATESAATEEDQFKLKRRSLGMHRLIGELYLRELLAGDIILACIRKLIAPLSITEGAEADAHEGAVPEPESIEALCQLTQTVGERLESESTEFAAALFAQLEALAARRKELGSRMCFMIKDLLLLKQEEWVSRRNEPGVQKVSELREQENRKLEGQHGKRQQSSSTASRPAPVVSADGWETVAVPTRRQRKRSSRGRGRGRGQGWRNQMSQKKKKEEESSEEEESSSEEESSDDDLGGGGAFAALNAAESSSEEESEEESDEEESEEEDDKESEPQPSKKKQEEDDEDWFVEPERLEEYDEELSKKIRALIAESFGSRDLDEACNCVRELDSHVRDDVEALSAEAIGSWVVHRAVYEAVQKRGDDEREFTATLLLFMIKEQVISPSSFLWGLQRVLECSQDWAIDIPLLPRHLGLMFARFARAGSLDLAFCHSQAMSPLAQSPYATKITLGLIEELLANKPPTSPDAGKVESDEERIAWFQAWYERSRSKLDWDMIWPKRLPPRGEKPHEKLARLLAKAELEP